jgi:hypothetical protein
MLLLFFLTRLCCESEEGGAGDLHAFPLGLHDGAEGVVEVDGGLVPVEDAPLVAGAAFGDGDGGDADEEGFADSLPAMLGADVEVFEIDSGVAAPGGVVVEVEGEAGGGGSVVFGEVGDDAVEAFGFAEAVAKEIGLGGEDGVGLALVGGEVADEGEDLGDVGGCGGAEVEVSLHGWAGYRLVDGVSRSRSCG